jgi:hypothetical protein
MEIIFLIWLCARDHELNSKQDKLFFLFSVNFFPFRKKQAVAARVPHAQTSKSVEARVLTRRRARMNKICGWDSRLYTERGKGVAGVSLTRGGVKV